MEIERSQALPPLAIEALKGARVARAQGSLESSTDLSIGTDTNQISDLAPELAHEQQPVQETPKARSQKVAHIKESVEDGTYSVPVELLAQKLLEGRSDGR